MQYDYGTIDPTETSGVELADALSQFRTALLTQHSGNTRPAYIVDNMSWLDTSGSDVVWKYYDEGTDADIEIGTFQTTGGLFRPANVDPESFATTTSSTVNATDADSNRVIVFQAAATLNLPVPAGVRDSWKIKVVAVGGNVTVDAPSPALVDGESNLVVQEGTSTTIYIVGSTYFTDLNFKFSSGGVPVGTIVYFATTTAPDGFLVCNGDAVTALYPDLRALLIAAGSPFGTTGGNPRLPDLRAEFIRGFDGGRGIDTGRVFGSLQLDQFQGHTFNVTTAGDTLSGSGVQNYRPGGTPASIGAPVSDGVNGTPRTGSETRPRNVAMLPCIKAFGAVAPEGMADLAALLTAIATQAEAEAGVDNLKIMTPLRTRQAALVVSGWELIGAPIDVSSPVAVIDWLNLGSFRELMLQVFMLPSVNASGIVRVSTNNGSSFLSGASDYGQVRQVTSGSTTSAASAPVSYMTFGDNSVSNTLGGRGLMKISNFNRLTACFAEAEAAIYNSSNVLLMEKSITASVVTAAIRNALRFQFTSGNIAAGSRFTLWGLRG